jgi:predicted dehydrogenase
MIDAAIVGMGRWGKTLLEAVQGKSRALRFTHAVSRDPDKLREYAAVHRLELVDTLESVLADPKIEAVWRRRTPCTARRSSRLQRPVRRYSAKNR